MKHEIVEVKRVEEIVLRLTPAEFLLLVRVLGFSPTSTLNDTAWQKFVGESDHGIAPADAYEVYCGLDKAAAAAGIHGTHTR